MRGYFICVECNMEFYIECMDDCLEFCPICGGLSLEMENGVTNEI